MRLILIFMITVVFSISDLPTLNLNLEENSTVNLSVLTLNGRVIKQYESIKTSSINLLLGMAPQVYLLKVETE